MKKAAAPLALGLAGKALNLQPGAIDHRLEGIIGNLFPAKLLGQGDDAQLQRYPEPNAVTESRLLRALICGTGEPDKFTGATANIEQHHSFRSRINKRSRADGGKP